MKRVIILGGGFAGLSVARQLLKLRQKDIEIVVMDERAAHVYTPWLYEVATAVTPDGVRVAEAKKTADIPYKHVPGFKDVRFLHEKVANIDSETRHLVCASGQTYAYDALVVAIGAITNDFGIKGVSSYALTLKTAQDARAVAERYGALLSDVRRGKLAHATVAVIGGGANGVELVGEMAAVRQRFIEEHAIDPQKLRVALANAGPDLVSAFPKPVRAKVEARLRDIHVDVLLNFAASSITADAVETASAKLPYDLLIWAAGVKARPEPVQWKLPVNERGRITVDQSFAIPNKERIFALGDCAARVDDKTHQPDPQSAQAACAQASTVAKNVMHALSGEELQSFRAPKWQVLLAVGGKYGVGSVFGILVSGRIAYAMRRMVDLKYFVSVFPIIPACKLWYRGLQNYARNDPA